MIDSLATIIPIALALFGFGAAIARGLWQAYARLEARFDRLEGEIIERGHRADVDVLNLKSGIREIEHRLETATAHRTIMESKFYRIDNAIMSLSGALKRVSDYEPRGPEDWPTDDPPTAIKNRLS